MFQFHRLLQGAEGARESAALQRRAQQTGGRVQVWGEHAPAQRSQGLTHSHILFRPTHPTAENVTEIPSPETVRIKR